MNVALKGQYHDGWKKYSIISIGGDRLGNAAFLCGSDAGIGRGFALFTGF